MKILLINHQIRPELSGVASHFENISKNLFLLGSEVLRLTVKDNNFKKKDPRIRYYFFEYRKKAPFQTNKDNKERIRENYANFESSLKKIDCESIDVVITSNDIYLSILKKYVAPQKILAIIPSSLTFSKHSNPNDYKSTIKRIKRNAEGIHLVVLSEKMKSMLLNLLGNAYQISVIPPGVDFEKFSQSHRRQNTNSLLFVGRIAEEKNIPALIDAARQVKNPYFLRIIGTGPLLEEMNQLVKKSSLNKKIIFEGRKTRVEGYYTQANIFVLPSKYEAFGLVILEAMASGLPVIAFRPGNDVITASDEIITDSVDGFLVSNTLEMAEKIDLLLKDSQLRIHMGDNAILKAKQYVWESHVKNLLQVLKH